MRGGTQDPVSLHRSEIEDLRRKEEEFRRKEADTLKQISTLEARLASKEEEVGVATAQIRVKSEALKAAQQKLEQKDGELLKLQVQPRLSLFLSHGVIPAAKTCSRMSHEGSVFYGRT